jgi:hypothetical protein
VKDRFQRSLQWLGQQNVNVLNQTGVSAPVHTFSAATRDAVAAAAKYQFNITDAFSKDQDESQPARADVIPRKAIDPSSADCCVLAFHTEVMRICKCDPAFADAYCSVSMPLIARFIVAPILSHYLRSDSCTPKSAIHNATSLRSLQVYMLLVLFF